MSIPRQNVSSADRWNVEAMYPDLKSWEKEFAVCSGEQPTEQSPYRWPAIAAFRGRLDEGAETLQQLLEATFELDRKLSKLYTYAHLRHDEDIAEDACKAANDRVMALLHGCAQEFSWIQPEILALSKETLNAYLKAPELEPYRFHLEKLIRLRDHTLDDKSESLLALAGKALQAPTQAFSALNNADLKFGSVKDCDGKKHEITHASFGLLLRDHDRSLRKGAFEQYHLVFESHSNTLAELLGGKMQHHAFSSKARHYKSCLEAALKPKNIDTAVYHNLVRTVRENLSSLHRYVSLRKQIMGLDDIHLYDMYVPMFDDVDIKMDYEEAQNVVVDSVAPLGKEYQDLLRTGLCDDRWVDRYENLNKRSGAYSSGCYDSMPYILMNYKGLLRDVSTLAHEAGHSMHSLLSRKTQPYHYADYPIFVAEVASTFNEALLNRTFRERFTSPQEQMFLIIQELEDLRGTLFRQTMFAEFELTMHEMAERDEPLTPNTLKEKYLQINRDYFGPEIIVDDPIKVEWARIPHFYYNFYVYQYATGISAAYALVQKVLEGDSQQRDAYLNFLKGGCSQYPIDLLKTAGVDMTSPEPVQEAVNSFNSLLDELEAATQQLQLS